MWTFQERGLSGDLPAPFRASALPTEYSQIQIRSGARNVFDTQVGPRRLVQDPFRAVRVGEGADRVAGAHSVLSQKLRRQVDEWSTLLPLLKRVFDQYRQFAIQEL